MGVLAFPGTCSTRYWNRHASFLYQFRPSCPIGERSTIQFSLYFAVPSLFLMPRSTAIKCVFPLTCLFTESFLTDVEPVTHIVESCANFLFDTQIAFYTYNFSIFYFFDKRALEHFLRTFFFISERFLMLLNIPFAVKVVRMQSKNRVVTVDCLL